MVCPCGTAAAPSLLWRHDKHFTYKPRALRGWRAASARTSSGRSSWPGTPTSLSTQPPSRPNVTTSRSTTLISLLLFFLNYSHHWFLQVLCGCQIVLKSHQQWNHWSVSLWTLWSGILVRLSLPLLIIFSSSSVDASSSTSTVTHPRPAKPDPPARGGSISTGSLTPIKSSPILNNGSPTILGKRSYEQHNGLDGEWQEAGFIPTLAHPTVLGGICIQNVD